MEQYWLGVEVRHLAALEAIDAERSFRGAAERLGYVQSAVSQQLATLERLVGTRLVERSRGHAVVELTEAGEVLLRHAERILATLSAARADLETLTSAAGRRLRVGTFESIATRIMPLVLANLGASHPDLEIETSEAADDRDLFDAVARGDLDCAFAELPLNPGPFEAAELMVDPSVLLVPSSSPLADRDDPPTLEEIAELPLITSTTWTMIDLIDQHFRSVGLKLTRRYEGATNVGVQALVSTELGAAIMPRLSVDTNLATTRVIDVSDLLPSRTLVLYWHRERRYGPALTTFLAATQTTCKPLGARTRVAADPALEPSATASGRFRRMSNGGRSLHRDEGDTTAALAS